MPFLAALPWKWIALGIAALAAIGAIVLGAKGALDNARTSGLKQGRAEIQARWDAEKAGAANARAELTSALGEAFTGLDGSLQRTIEKVSSDGQTIRVKVQQEMAGDPRYASADCSISDGVRAQVDAARRLSGPAPVASGGSDSVSPSGAIVRFELGPSGQR